MPPVYPRRVKIFCPRCGKTHRYALIKHAIRKMRDDRSIEEIMAYRCRSCGHLYYEDEIPHPGQGKSALRDELAKATTEEERAKVFEKFLGSASAKEKKEGVQ